MKKSRILTYKRIEGKKIISPMSYVLHANNQYIFYFGGNHSRSISNPQYALLDSQWNKFLSATDEKKRIVMVEGGVPPVKDSKSSTISNYAEVGYVTWLSSNDHVRTVSPEATIKEQAKILLKDFTKDELAYYYFARVVYQWQHFKAPKPEMKKYINSFLVKDKKQLIWKAYDFSIKHMEKIHMVLFGEPINYNDKAFFNELLNPYGEAIINRIHRQTAYLRDVAIVGAIKKELEKGKSIFAVFGSSHAVMQKPELRYLMKSYK